MNIASLAYNVLDLALKDYIFQQVLDVFTARFNMVCTLHHLRSSLGALLYLPHYRDSEVA